MATRQPIRGPRAQAAKGAQAPVVPAVSTPPVEPTPVAESLTDEELQAQADAQAAEATEAAQGEDEFDQLDEDEEQVEPDDAGEAPYDPNDPPPSPQARELPMSEVTQRGATPGLNYSNGRLTRASMEAVIRSGGSVTYRGQVLTTMASLPSDAELAVTQDQKAASAAAIDAQIAALQAQKESLR